MRPLFLFEGSSSRSDLKANLLFKRSARALFLRDPKDPLSLQIQLSAFHHNLQRFCHHRQLRRTTFSHLRNILSSSGQRDMVLYSIHTWLRYVINATAYLLHYLQWDVFHETSKGWISIQDTRPYVSGMQTRETLSHSKLCDFIFQKIWWALASLSWVDKRHESSVRIGNVQGKQ